MNCSILRCLNVEKEARLKPQSLGIVEEEFAFLFQRLHTWDYTNIVCERLSHVNQHQETSNDFVGLARLFLGT